ncbi:MAG: UDP-3-O-(3-hydroxymyristoyl)glucosamine N-acyltransferase [Reinekea sp.]|nr:UDP-3-O-(3-hydroxymyristoyl)glucosamine N-acyltransferase [Reinekea sp.]
MVTIATLIAECGLTGVFSKEQEALVLTSVAPLDKATTGQLSFLSSVKFRRHLETTHASAVFVTEKAKDMCPEGTLALVCDDPYLAYAKASVHFDQTPVVPEGVHETAVLGEGVRLGAGVRIGPNVVIGAHAVLADGVQIGANSVLQERVVIGQFTRLAANVTVHHQCELGEYCVIQSGAVIGSDGFGYAPTDSGWQAIAQVGRVIIGDRVAIGANCTVDRGAIEDTVIEDDVIIDNLCQVAHNVRIGHRTALAGQVGIAGSTVIGASCTIGGQAGFAGHINIADNSHFTGQAMVTKGTTEPGLYSSGIPAQSNREWRKMVARVRQLESIIERIAALEAVQGKEES